MTTREDIDSFYQFATHQLDGGSADWSLEECVSRWRHLRNAEVKPFASGRTLRDELEDAGILGSGDGGPDDLASNPDHMQGFGET